MALSFDSFIKQIISTPVLIIPVILIMGVIIVNGWTDAPNAIAACVSTGVMQMKHAVRMAAVCNLSGMIFMSLFSSKVALTIFHIADFGGNPKLALTALCAAMLSVIIWAVTAWIFGIPTSESHAVVAGLTGASVAICNGFTGINGQEWKKVIYGLILSVVLGFILGLISGKAVHALCKSAEKINSKKINQKKSKLQTKSIVEKAQIAGSAAMAFMHGAQDGQKLMGVFLLTVCLASGNADRMEFQIPLWMMLMCSLLMAAGTAVGGKRIIRKIGTDMVQLEKPQGAAADAAGAVCLLIACMAGLPVSTTHVKTTAIMGVGAAEDPAKVDERIAEEMIAAWILTFPGCGLIGFLTAKLFLL